MAMNIEYEDWIREKRADIAQHNLSIQANIAALSQRLWKAELVYGATFAADLYDRIIAKRNERKHR